MSGLKGYCADLVYTSSLAPAAPNICRTSECGIGAVGTKYPVDPGFIADKRRFRPVRTDKPVLDNLPSSDFRNDGDCQCVFSVSIIFFFSLNSGNLRVAVSLLKVAPNSEL